MKTATYIAAVLLTKSASFPIVHTKYILRKIKYSVEPELCNIMISELEIRITNWLAIY